MVTPPARAGRPRYLVRYAVKLCTWAPELFQGGVRLRRDCPSLASHNVAPGICLCRRHNAEYLRRHVEIVGSSAAPESVTRAQGEALKLLWGDSQGETLTKERAKLVVGVLFRAQDASFGVEDVPEARAKTLDDLIAEKEGKSKAASLEARVFREAAQRDVEREVSLPISRPIASGTLLGKRTLTGSDAVEWTE